MPARAEEAGSGYVRSDFAVALEQRSVGRYSPSTAGLLKRQLSRLDGAGSCPLNHPDTEKAKARYTVLEPIEIYVEVEGGR
jgi:hypothetical protein